MKYQYQFSFGYVLVLQYFLLIIPANFIVISPSGDVYSLVKSSLQINCSYSMNDDVPMGKLALQHCIPREDCTALSSIPIDNVTITHYLKNVSRADTGVYACKIDKKAEDFMDLYVDDVPQIPTTINCYSLDRSEMVCSWDITEANQGSLKINWTASSIEYGSIFRQCPRWKENEKTLTCKWPSSWNETNLTKTFQYIADVYTIALKGVNKLGEGTKTFLVNISQIVKLSQFKLEVVSTGSSDITIRWTIPVLFKLSSFNITTVYNITYTSRWNTVPIQATFVSSNTSLVYTVKDIFAYTQYFLSLTGRPIESRYWSDITVKNITTRAKEPGRSPQMVNGIYYIEKLKLHKRNLTVFLKSINEKHVNSYFANYSIILSEITQLNETQVCSYNITYTTVTVKFELEPDKLYRISGSSYNDVGYSNESSEIIIPAANSYVPAVKYAFVEKMEDSNEYLFSWEAYEDHVTKQVSSYSLVVFWCKGSTKGTFCEDDVEWSIVPNNKSSTRILIDKYDQYQLLFGVSIYDQYTNISGGLHFADCVFPSSKVIERPEIELIANKANTMRLDVLLISDFCQYESQPMEYLLYYGENRWTNDLECEDIIDEMSVLNYTATPDVKTKAIDNLKSDTDYSVCFKVLLRNARFKISDRKTKRTLSTGQTEMVMITSTVIGTIFVVMIIFAICYLKRRYENEEMRIEIPEIQKYEKIPGYEISNNGGFTLENMEKNYCDLMNSRQSYKKTDDSGHYSDIDAKNQISECFPNTDETESVIMETCIDTEKSYMSVEFGGGVNSNYPPYPSEPNDSSNDTELEYEIKSTSPNTKTNDLHACPHGELVKKQKISTPNISTFLSNSCRDSSVCKEGTSSGTDCILYTNNSDASDYRQVYCKHKIRSEICSNKTNTSEESRTHSAMPDLENISKFQDSDSDADSEMNGYIYSTEEPTSENGYSYFKELESNFCESDAEYASDILEYCKVTNPSNSTIEYKEYLTSL